MTVLASHEVVRDYIGLQGHHVRFLPFPGSDHKVLALGSLQSEVVSLEGGLHATEVQEAIMLADLATPPRRPDGGREGAAPGSRVRPLANLLHAGGAVTALATHSRPDGRAFLLSGSRGGHLHCVVLDMPTGADARVESIQVRGGVCENEDGSISTDGAARHSGAVAAVDACPKTAQVLTAGEDGALRVWQLASLLEGGDGCVELAEASAFRSFRAAKWTMPQTLAAAGTTGGVGVWDARRPGAPVSVSPPAWGFQGHGGGDKGRRILSVAAHASRPHVVATGTTDGVVSLWDLRFLSAPVGATLASADGSAGAVWQVQFDAAVGPDGRTPVIACTESGLLASVMLEGSSDGAVTALAHEPVALVAMDIDGMLGNSIVACSDQECIVHIDRSTHVR